MFAHSALGNLFAVLVISLLLAACCLLNWLVSFEKWLHVHGLCFKKNLANLLRLLHYELRGTEQGCANTKPLTSKHWVEQWRFAIPNPRQSRTPPNGMYRQKINGRTNASLLQAASEDVQVQQRVETVRSGRFSWAEYCSVFVTNNVKAPRELGAAGGGCLWKGWKQAWAEWPEKR